MESREHPVEALGERPGLTPDGHGQGSRELARLDAGHGAAEPSEPRGRPSSHHEGSQDDQVSARLAEDLGGSETDDEEPPHRPDRRRADESPVAILEGELGRAPPSPEQGDILRLAALILQEGEGRVPGDDDAPVAQELHHAPRDEPRSRQEFLDAAHGHLGRDHAPQAALGGSRRRVEADDDVGAAWRRPADERLRRRGGTLEPLLVGETGPPAVRRSRQRDDRGTHLVDHEHALEIGKRLADPAGLHLHDGWARRHGSRGAGDRREPSSQVALDLRADSPGSSEQPLEDTNAIGGDPIVGEQGGEDEERNGDGQRDGEEHPPEGGAVAPLGRRGHLRPPRTRRDSSEPLNGSLPRSRPCPGASGVGHAHVAGPPRRRSRLPATGRTDPGARRARRVPVRR